MQVRSFNRIVSQDMRNLSATPSENSQSHAEMDDLQPWMTVGGDGDSDGGIGGRVVKGDGASVVFDSKPLPKGIQINGARLRAKFLVQVLQNGGLCGFVADT